MLRYPTASSKPPESTLVHAQPQIVASHTNVISCFNLLDKGALRVQYAFLGGSADNIKKYKLPNGEFAHNMIQQQAGIINSMAINEDGVVASGADNGSLWCARRFLAQCGGDTVYRCCMRIRLWRPDTPNALKNYVQNG